MLDFFWYERSLSLSLSLSLSPAIATAVLRLFFCTLDFLDAVSQGFALQCRSLFVGRWGEV